MMKKKEPLKKPWPSKTKKKGWYDDDDYVPSDEDEDEDEDGFGVADDGDPRPMCNYGMRCYRSNEEHVTKFRHPIGKAAAAAKAPKVKKSKVHFCRRKECGEPCRLRVEELDPGSLEYERVKKALLSSNAHGFTFPEIVRIKRVEHAKLDKAFKAAPGAFNRLELWHGTKYGFVTSILHAGFQLPSHKLGMFGAGLYFAKDSSKSWQYSLKHGSNVIILCNVALGTPKQVLGADHEICLKSLLPKHHSVYAKAGTCVAYDERVVYTPEQAVVSCVVEFRREAVKSVDKLPLCSNAACFDVTPGHTSMFRHS
jgi:hypothetical protein